MPENRQKLMANWQHLFQESLLQLPIFSSTKSFLPTPLSKNLYYNILNLGKRFVKLKFSRNLNFET